MKSIVFRRTYLLVLVLASVASFLAFGGFAWLSVLASNRAALMAVQAAGPLPTFETQRTDRLNSDHHKDAVLLVTTQARRADGAEVTVEEDRANPLRVASAYLQ